MFITFEGPDGSGKTTVIKKLVDKLLTDKPNLQYVLTREPGGNIKEAERIRNIILDNDSNLSSMAEALLFTASRRIHIDRILLPALKENKLALCDRYIDSFYVYQGLARGLGLDVVRKMTEMVIEGLVPDITVYLSITPEQSEYRRKVAKDVSDRMDSQNLDFHKKVIKGYKQLINEDPERFIVVDAWQSVDDVLNEIYEKLLRHKKFKKWWSKVK